MRKAEKAFHPVTEKAMETYSWPGNIRELRNVVERGLLMSAGSRMIMPHHLSLPARSEGSGAFALRFDHHPALDELKAQYLARTLEIHGGNRTLTARAMGISERNLYRLLAETSDGPAPKG